MSLQKYFYDSENGLRSWRPCEANDLIEVFESHSYLFGVMPSDDDVWILISSALQRRGIDVTARQVRRKWNRMRGTFHSISNCKTNPTPSLCQHLRCAEERRWCDLNYNLRPVSASSSKQQRLRPICAAKDHNFGRAAICTNKKQTLNPICFSNRKTNLYPFDSDDDDDMIFPPCVHQQTRTYENLKLMYELSLLI